MSLDIRHEVVAPQGMFRAYDDEGALGSMVYVRSGPDVVIVQHTGVEARGRGQGVGRALFEHLVGWARESGTKIVAQCAYARRMFREHPDARDVLR